MSTSKITPELKAMIRLLARAAVRREAGLSSNTANSAANRVRARRSRGAPDAIGLSSSSGPGLEPKSTPASADRDQAPSADDQFRSWGIKEAAAFLRIHPATLSERAHAGEIPACKVGRSWVFMPDLLAEYLRSRTKVHVEKVKGVRYNMQASLAERLAARRSQLIASKRKSRRDR